MNWKSDMVEVKDHFHSENFKQHSIASTRFVGTQAVNYGVRQQ